MRMDMTADAVTFLVTVLSGMACGVLYDVFSFFGITAGKKSLIPFFDLVIVSSTALIVVAVFYIFNSYQLRAFMFVGILGGLLLYFLTISRLFNIVLEKIMKIFHFILKILLTPARFLYKILLVCVFSPARKCFAGVGNFFVKKFKKIINIRGLKGYEKNSNKKRNNKKRKTEIIGNSGGSNCSGNVYKRCDASAADN